MKVVFNTWQGAFFNPGGGEVQLLNSRAELLKKNCHVELLDMWQPQKDCDLFHQFSLELGSHHATQLYKDLKKKIVISPIYWSEPDTQGFAYQYVRNVMIKADLLMPNSDVEGAKLSRHFDIPLERFHKVRNGVAAEYLTDGDPQLFRQRYQIEGDFLLSVANIDERKNTHRLLQACAALNLKLISIGHIRDIPYYESFAKTAKNFVHLGPIQDVNLLKSAFRACRLFVLPSLVETPGIAALEAAAQGAALVITSVGCTEEYFGDRVSYVDPESVESIRSGIERELQQTNRSQLKAWVREHYTWERAGADILAGYKKLLGESC